MNMKKVILFLLFFSIFGGISVFAQDEDASSCDDVYKPVCASVEVQCIKAPCNPVLQTFWNKCEMKQNQHATFLYEWECKDWISMNNPASVKCTNDWWKLELYQDKESIKYNVCIFENWKVCEEWSYYRWECKSEVEDAPICNASYAPVCWIDNKTYWNSCLAQNTWFKYEWKCLWIGTENTLKKSWDSVYWKISTKHSDLFNALLLEKLILRSSALAKESNSETWYAAYNYLWFIALDTLRNDIFNSYIKKNINNISSDVKPVLGWKWHLVDIEWQGQNLALVKYEDWHIQESTKINITAKSTWIEIKKLEDKINITQKYNDKNFAVSLKIPIDWYWLYSYKFSKNYLEFFYKANRESNATLFRINFFTKDQWKDVKNGDLYWQYSLISNLEDYIIAFSTVPLPEYKIDENLSNYSIMKDYLPEIKSSVKVNYK